MRPPEHAVFLDQFSGCVVAILVGLTVGINSADAVARLIVLVRPARERPATFVAIAELYGPVGQIVFPRSAHPIRVSDFCDPIANVVADTEASAIGGSQRREPIEGWNGRTWSRYLGCRRTWSASPRHRFHTKNRLEGRILDLRQASLGVARVMNRKRTVVDGGQLPSGIVGVTYHRAVRQAFLDQPPGLIVGETGRVAFGIGHVDQLSGRVVTAPPLVVEWIGGLGHVAQSVVFIAVAAATGENYLPDSSRAVILIISQVAGLAL